MLNGITRLLFIALIALFMLSCKSGPKQEELFNQAKQYQEESNFSGAVDTYKDIVKRFPRAPEAPQCQFMIGYLYANHLHNLDLAREAYTTFIKNYPEHELIKDAQWELDHLGKDVNQIEELNKILTKDSVQLKADSVR